jgi:hypothetical protein
MAPSTRKVDVKTKRIEKMQTRIVQQQAFKDLLVLRHANGGKRKKGDIKKYQMNTRHKVLVK